MLHEKDPVETNRHIAELLPALLKTISDSADEVHFTQSSYVVVLKRVYTLIRSNPRWCL